MSRTNVSINKIKKCNKENKCGKQLEESHQWTLINAFEFIYRQAENSGLSDVFWNDVSRSLDFLREKLQFTNMQIVILSVLAEAEEALTWKKMADFLSCTRLTMIAYTEDIEDLVEKGWVIRQFSGNLRGQRQEVFALEQGVVAAMQKNKVFVPEKIDGLTEQQFVDKLKSHLDKKLRGMFVKFHNVEEWMMRLVKANASLPLCRKALSYHDIHVVSLLLLVVYEFSKWADADNEGLHIDTIDRFYLEEWECIDLRRKLQNGSHVLIQDGIIESKCEDGMADNEQFVLTTAAQEKLLSGYKPDRSPNFVHITKCHGMKSHREIIEKQLFYNPCERKQIQRLNDILSIDMFSDIQKRLADEGMRIGVSCLFYGAPGTGKTETVYQIARKAERDIVKVDIEGIRDKFVGETEKRIKAVFSNYRQLCKRTTVVPILFFNEADAIFNKRTSIAMNPAVEKMENAMQNILLQELENFAGILIATTNLTENLDKAFERRFLFKIEFGKPAVNVKTKIWKSMIKDINEEDAIRLASIYDFSGGQIENIARQLTINRVIYGKQITFDTIDDYCRHEIINKNTNSQNIGFRI